MYSFSIDLALSQWAEAKLDQECRFGVIAIDIVETEAHCEEADIVK